MYFPTLPAECDSVIRPLNQPGGYSPEFTGVFQKELNPSHISSARSGQQSSMLGGNPCRNYGALSTLSIPALGVIQASCRLAIWPANFCARHPPAQVVGCKADMEASREVSTEEGQAFAEFYGVKFLETSAKTGLNVEEAFETIARDIYAKVESGEFKLEDGWDGIKTGFFRPGLPGCYIDLLEAKPESAGCC